MAMTLRDIINKLLRRQPASASTARERLQLVLAHDRVRSQYRTFRSNEKRNT